MTMTITEDKPESQTEKDITPSGENHITQKVQQTATESSRKRPACFPVETEEYHIHQMKYVKQEWHQTKELEIKYECEWGIQSLYREGQMTSDGNLLKAEENTGHQDEVDVNFKGTNPSDPATVFYAERSEKHSNQDDVFTLRCHLGNKEYYLATNDSEVYLQKWTHRTLPSEGKYLFQVTSVNSESEYKTITSVETGRYLECNDNGDAVMKEVKDRDGKSQVDGKCQLEDRKAWFEVIEKCEKVTEEHHVHIAQAQQVEKSAHHS